MHPHDSRHDVDRNEQFGRYRIRGVLGEGGMGRLYLAEQTGIEGFAKIVALKRILPHLADSPHFRRLFLTEARVAARLEHPHIVATHELGEVDGTYFIAMEYLAGEDTHAIAARCRSGRPMPVEIAATLAQQSATGLHHAHEMRDGLGRAVGLVHRDVNPSNIFVTYYGMVKLLDFGVAKDMTSSAVTNPGIFKGKYAYCAPEQVTGEPLDRRTDVFCLGIVLWECLTGRRLFDGSSDVATIEAVRWQDVTPPSALRPEVPPELDAIVGRALTRDRAGRFASAAEMGEALEAFLVRHRHRTTARNVASWMEDLFGAERASLKLAMARGAGVETALTRLRALDADQGASEPSGSGGPLSTVRPRALWSTSLGPVPGRAPDPEPEPTVGPGFLRRELGKVVVAVTAGAVVIAAALLVPGRGRPARAPVATGLAAIAVDSEPAGAHLFVDGNPTGLQTPAVLRGLRPGRALELRLDKAGYTPVTRQLAAAFAAEPRRESFRLQPATGLVRFAGLPARARVYLDDRPIDPTGVVAAAVGTRRLRVESGDRLLVERAISIEPGDQTVRLNTSALPGR